MSNYLGQYEESTKRKVHCIEFIIKRIKGQQTNILTLYLKVLEKVGQINTKTSKRQGTIKTRFEINEIITKDTILNNEKIENWFFEKIN